jgi:hypothetical protein
VPSLRAQLRPREGAGPLPALLLEKACYLQATKKMPEKENWICS